jgi:hypothetical protein
MKNMTTNAPPRWEYWEGTEETQFVSPPLQKEEMIQLLAVVKKITEMASGVMKITHTADPTRIYRVWIPDVALISPEKQRALIKISNVPVKDLIGAPQKNE